MAKSAVKEPVMHEEPFHDSTANPSSMLPYGLAWAVAICVFLLISVGGLVTTIGAGMSVPDWPSSFQYWIWLPIQIWTASRDIFLEHFHRLIGILLGSLTLALAIAVGRLDRRRAVRWLSVIALLAVCFQGLLGGLRVIQNAALLADVHGCTAPLFFSLTAVLVVLTSRTWINPPATQPVANAVRLRRLTTVFPCLFYLQIVAGAQMRHMLVGISVAWFPLWFWIHLINAAVLVSLLGWLWFERRTIEDAPILCNRILLLNWLCAGQLVVGALAWVAKYGWPNWVALYVWPLDYTVVTGGPFQAVLLSTHVSVGAILLVTSLSIALWSRRLVS
jgi:cytochrome c oxidase assembly protein subunit 15